MNWDAVAAVGEILGAVAVVISLIYLARQIQIQNQQSRVAAMHEISTGFRAATSRMIEDDLGEIWVKALEDIESLNDVERTKLIVGATTVIRSWEEAYILHDIGNLEPRIWAPMTSYYRFLLSSSPLTWVWERRKEHFDSKFRDYVDKLERREYSLK